MGLFRHRSENSERQTSSHGQSFEDLDNLLTTCAVLSALILAFIVSLSSSTDYGALDRGNFREAYYDWPNRDFVDFVVFTLEKENFNFTVELERDKVIDVKSILTNRYEDICDNYHGSGDSSHSCNALSNLPYRNAEGALEIIYPVFPINKLRAFLNFHPEAKAIINRSQNFYKFIPVALNFSVVCLLGAVVLSVALALSDSREDVSGECLKKFSRVAIPTIIVCYVLLFIGTVFFLIAAGAISATLDTFLYRTEAFYSYFAYCFTLPCAVLFLALGFYLVPHASLNSSGAAVSSSDDDVQKKDSSINKKDQDGL